MKIIPLSCISGRVQSISFIKVWKKTFFRKIAINLSPILSAWPLATRNSVAYKKNLYLIVQDRISKIKKHSSEQKAGKSTKYVYSSLPSTRYFFLLQPFTAVNSALRFLRVNNFIRTIASPRGQNKISVKVSIYLIFRLSSFNYKTVDLDRNEKYYWFFKNFQLKAWNFVSTEK